MGCEQSLEWWGLTKSGNWQVLSCLCVLPVLVCSVLLSHNAQGVVLSKEKTLIEPTVLETESMAPATAWSQ